MKKMSTLITTRVSRVHGGRIISGAINAASRLLKTVTAQVWLC